MTDNNTVNEIPEAVIAELFKSNSGKQMPRAERRKLERASKKGDKKLATAIMPLIQDYYEFILNNHDQTQQIAKFNNLNERYLRWLTMNREYKFVDFKSEFTSRVVFMLQGLNKGILKG